MLYFPYKKLKGGLRIYSINAIDFKCERCGKRCKHRGNLALTPMDVFQISKHLEISCEETVQKYTRLSHRHNFPQLVLLAEGKQNVCIFYDRRIGCKIYSVRPAQCYLFPLIPLTSISDPNPEFTIRQCNSKVSSNTKVDVQDWIRSSSARYEREKDIFKWYIEQLSKIEYFCRTKTDELDMIKNLLYCQYDLSKDMDFQIRANLSKIFS